MEQIDKVFDDTLSATARVIAAQHFGCTLDDLAVVAVSGGYSRNRRSLVSDGDTWLFAKEVDTTLLPDDGAEELAWLSKDYELTTLLRQQMPELVPEWSQLSVDKHTLLMTSYREQDGWLWSLPVKEADQSAYMQAVIDATKKLEVAQFDTTTVEQLNLQPYFRDKLAFDGSLREIKESDVIWDQLVDKYGVMLRDESTSHLYLTFRRMQALLENSDELATLAVRAAQLHDQAQDRFNHCDVRSDNITYNSLTHEVIFVDWNWASFAPIRFGSTEFLIDMARRGVDVTPWVGELNPEMLAATVGLYARRCLEAPHLPGSTLREMQAQSAAVALSLYDMTSR